MKIISEFSEQESIRGSFNTTTLNSFTEEKRLEHKTFRENSPYSEILSLSASSSSSFERIPMTQFRIGCFQWLIFPAILLNPSIGLRYLKQRMQAALQQRKSRIIGATN